MWKRPFYISLFFKFRHNSPEMRKQTLRLLLRSPRPPSAAAVSRCRVSALAAWRTSRCWRPSWGPIPAVTSCMWWTPGPRLAHCENQPDSVFLHVQVGFMFSSCALSAGCGWVRVRLTQSLGNTPPVWLWGYVTWLCPLNYSDFPEKKYLLPSWMRLQTGLREKAMKTKTTTPTLSSSSSASRTSTSWETASRKC